MPEWLLHSPPKPDQDAWLPITEDFETGEDEGKLSKWLDGVYICKFPPHTGDNTIQIELDITQPLTPVSWIIQTSPDNPFYPGRHAGKLELPAGFPIEQAYIIWLLLHCCCAACPHSTPIHSGQQESALTPSTLPYRRYSVRSFRAY